MAGHSQFKNIMHRKGKQDAKRGKAFTKMGGSLGETNSVSFMFDRVGIVRYPAAVASEDAMLEAAIDAGADNVESDDQAHEVTVAPDRLIEVRDALEARFGAPESAK